MNAAKWDYGNAGDLYPVRAGQTWEVGQHRFTCGDLEDGGAAVIAQTQADVAYCDPPWNPGNCSAFRTKAGVPRKVNFALFMDALAKAVKTTGGNVFLEMGVKHAAEVVKAMENQGGQLLSLWNITYYRKKPCRLGMFNWSGVPDTFTRNLTGMDDENTPDAVLSSYPPGLVVLDPCCGRGLTARAAHRAGHRFVGMELHPRRMADGLLRLSQLTGEEPRRVG